MLTQIIPPLRSISMTVAIGSAVLVARDAATAGRGATSRGSGVRGTPSLVVLLLEDQLVQDLLAGYPGQACPLGGAGELAGGIGHVGSHLLNRAIAQLPLDTDAVQSGGVGILSARGHSGRIAATPGPAAIYISHSGRRVQVQGIQGGKQRV